MKVRFEVRVEPYRTSARQELTMAWGTHDERDEKGSPCAEDFRSRRSASPAVQRLPIPGEVPISPRTTSRPVDKEDVVTDMTSCHEYDDFNLHQVPSSISSSL